MTIGPETRVVLVGGTSHAGKSALAAALAGQLGWALLSTDQLARHPGRPWRDHDRDVPAHVAAHFAADRSPDALLSDVIAHYRNNVWPIADAIVRCRVANPFDDRLVLEGSALMPESIAGASYGAAVAPIWLTAPAGELAERIRAESGHSARSARGRALIDTFLARALAFDRVVRDEAAQHRLPILDSQALDVGEDLVAQLGLSRRGQL